MTIPLTIQLGYQLRNRVIITVRGQTDIEAGWLDVYIQAFAGGFEGTTSGLIPPDDLRYFYTRLKDLYQTLQGQTGIGTIDGEFNAVLEGNGLGHIQGKFEVSDEIAELSFTTELDQTFLPKIIDEIEQVIKAYPSKP